MIENINQLFKQMNGTEEMVEGGKAVGMVGKQRIEQQGVNWRITMSGFRQLGNTKTESECVSEGVVC